MTAVRPARVSERREEILAIAGELFAKKGFVTTTVREIADAAGILSGSLYHHFDSKEAMVDELIAGFLHESVAGYRRAIEAGDDPVSVMQELIRQAFTTIGAHRTAVAVMQNEFTYLVQFPRFAYLAKLADEAEELWVGVLGQGMRAGLFRSDVDPALVYRFMRDAIWLTVRWHQPEGQYDLGQVADMYLVVLLNGLVTGRRRRWR